MKSAILICMILCATVPTVIRSIAPPRSTAQSSVSSKPRSGTRTGVATILFLGAGPLAKSCSTDSGRQSMKATDSINNSTGSKPACSVIWTGWATWYSTNSVVADYKRRGQAIPTNGVFPMANGKPLNDNAMTCALWIVGKNGRPRKPDGRVVKITSVQNGDGTTMICAWTDNGPGSVPRSRGVVVDLTPKAMRELAGEAGIKAGRVEVRVEIING